jgi:hypothetical protein
MHKLKALLDRVLNVKSMALVKETTIQCLMLWLADYLIILLLTWQDFSMFPKMIMSTYCV